MKNVLRYVPMAVMALFLTLFMTSCELLGDVFKAGAWTGIIGVILVIALIFWLISRLFGGGRS